MSKPIFLPGLLSSPQGLKDNTFKFTIYCNELPPEKIGQIFTLNNKYVYIALKEEDFINEEIEFLDTLKAAEPIGKKPSQRVRSLLFLNWKNDNEGFADAESYYRFKMEKIIDHLKSKLPE